jgi:hypothetical protein
MNSPDEIGAFIKKTVAEQFPRVEPVDVRQWIAARLTEPYQVQLSANPEGTQVEDFWIVTDHKDGKHYRIAFSPQDAAFGIATPLASGVDWYMGDYGTFKEAAEGM